MRQFNRTSFITLVILFFTIQAHALPKYGPLAVPLSKNSNRSYFPKSDASDFWALIPYYTAQSTKQGCSAATFAMVMNAARLSQSLKSDQPLVTFESFVKQYTDASYRQSMLASSPGVPGSTFRRRDVSFVRLQEVLLHALKKLGLSSSTLGVNWKKIDLKDKETARKIFHEDLVKNEKGPRDFMVIAFVQGLLTGDPEGPSHVAAIGAYDAEHKQVLIMDPDREWYEPYWSQEDHVFDAMAQKETDPDSPGWLYITL